MHQQTIVLPTTTLLIFTRFFQVWHFLTDIDMTDFDITDFCTS